MIKVAVVDDEEKERSTLRDFSADFKGNTMKKFRCRSFGRRKSPEAV